jgi:transposase
MMNARENRGLAIAAQSQIIRQGNQWIVPSQTSGKLYTVDLFLSTCTCLDFAENAHKCKHLYAVELLLQRESGAQLPEPLPRKTYRQEWHEYNLAQVNEKARFLELLYELCKGVEDPAQTFGRPRLPFADRLFCVVYKIYSTVSSRRFSSDLRDALQKGFISQAPHFNSVSNYLEDETLTPYLKQLIIESSLPLKTIDWNFAVDSSGFSTGIYQKWSDAKWGNARVAYGEKQPNEVNRKDWIKVHLMCGVKTNIVTAVEITHAHAGDSPQFAPLLETTSQGFPIQSVMGDKAYSAEKNLKLVLIKGGTPYIAFRKNATAGNRRSGSVWKRMYLYYQMNQERFAERYHRRSNVETTFSMIKAKFGERLRSKSATGQVNEVLCKILCHNVCCLIQSIYELGVEPTFWNEYGN